MSITFRDWLIDQEAERLEALIERHGEDVELCKCGLEVEQCSYSHGCRTKNADDLRRMFARVERQRRKRLQEAAQ